MANRFDFSDLPDAPDSVETPAAFPRRLIATGAALVGLAIVIAFLVISSHDQPTPAEILDTALERLDQRDDAVAKNLASHLKDIKYHDPNFGGGIDFIFGITAFRRASSYALDLHTQSQDYREAIRYLEATLKNSLIAERRAEWSFALGVSLFEVNRVAEAQIRLEEAYRTYPPGRLSAAIRLADCYIDPTTRTPELVVSADELNRLVLESEDVTSDQRDSAWRQRPRILLAQGKTAEARQWVQQEQFPPETAERPDTQLVLAEIDIAEEKYADAVTRLAPIIERRLIDPTAARRASYLIGLAYELQRREEDAVIAYRRVLREFDSGEETVPAGVRLGDLYRIPPRSLHEDALVAYTAAIEGMPSPNSYRNRWMSLSDVRQHMRAAWTAWTSTENFGWAIQLAQQLSPLFDQVDALQMVAEASERAAEAAQRKYDQLAYSARPSVYPALMSSWRRSGRAYAHLADRGRADARFPNWLWKSAHHYRAGHDINSALDQTEAFLLTNQPAQRPAAMVLAGQLMLDLHKPGDNYLVSASSMFQRVIDQYPTSDAAFDAQYYLGESFLEQDRWEDAEAVWLSLLNSDELSPDAKVWELALGSLGELLFHAGEMAALRAREAEKQRNPESALVLNRLSASRWAEAIRLLDGFLQRAGNSSSAPAARFTLAKTLQRSVSQPQRELAVAETANARQELQHRIDTSLRRALEQLEILIRQLDPKFNADRLNAVNRRILRDSYFECAHTAFMIGDLNLAIERYGEAANRFPNDPQVLLAYLQIATCLDRQGRSTEARGYLERARIIRSQISDSEYTPSASSLDKLEWESLLERATRIFEPIGSTRLDT